MALINLSYSQSVRDKITATQASSISKLYKQAASNVAKNAKKLQGLNTTSAFFKKQQLAGLQQKLNLEIARLSGQIKNMVMTNAGKIAQAVALDNAAWAAKAGMNITGAYSSLPKDIIYKIKNGTIYDKKWFLNDSIWGSVKKQHHDINWIVSRGIAENKSTFDIAKDIEKYVDPSAVKPWDWNKVYPGTNKVVDYNAQRLARTLTAHAYQQSLVLATKDNPFVEALEWRSAQIHNRTCELCMQRHGQRYKPTELPADHPNGLCTYLTVVDDLEKVADRIGSWVNGNPDPAIDKYAKSMFKNYKPFGVAL